MKSNLIALLIGAGVGAWLQNLAWDYDSFGLMIVWLPGIPILAAAVLCWRKGVRRGAMDRTL